jgi:hypothetical protein
MAINIINASTNEFGHVQIDPQPRHGTSITLITHNFADKCGWYEKSVEVVDEIAADSGDQLTYNLANDFIVDVQHGRVTFENDVDTKYHIDVRVNDVAKTLDTDFTVDYDAGSITFNSALSGPDVVKVTYWYVDNVAGNSIFTLQPAAGKILVMLGAELQFSEDVQTNLPNLHFTTYMYVDPYGVIAVKDTVYKNVKDLVNESNNGSWIIDPIADITKKVRVFPFNYPSSKDIKSSSQMRVEAWIEGTDPIKNTTNGALELATGTFYCMITDDPDYVAP